MKIKTTTRKKKPLWIIMYSSIKEDFITFEIDKLDPNMSFERSITLMIRADSKEFREIMKRDYKAKVKEKRQPKLDHHFREVIVEEETDYTEIYFESKEDAEQAVDWIRGKLIMYVLEHPEYNVSTYE